MTPDVILLIAFISPNVFRRFAAHSMFILYCLILVVQVADAWVEKDWESQTQQMMAGAGNQSGAGKELSSEIDIHPVLAEEVPDWNIWFTQAEEDKVVFLCASRFIPDIPIYLRQEVLRL